jgi:hypothetical protein
MRLLPARHLLLTALLFVLAALPALAQTVLLEAIPPAAPIGVPFTIQASGLAPGAPYTLQVLGVENEDVLFATDLVASPDGRASIQLTGEPSDPLGDVTLRLLDGDEPIAETTFTLLAAPAPDPAQPAFQDDGPTSAIATLRITPASISAGQSVAVFISALQPAELVTVSVVDDEGAEAYRREQIADINGRIRFDLFTGAESASAQMTVTVLNSAGEAIATGTFGVTGQEPVVARILTPPGPFIDGLVGPVTAFDLPPFTDVTFRIQGPDGDVVIEGVVRSNVDGVVNFYFPPRTDLPDGLYTVDVLLDGEVVGSGELISIYDPQPTVLISPAAGPRGTEFTIEAIHGMEPNEAFDLIVFLGETEIYRTAHTADDAGSFTTILLTEASDPAGEYEVVIVPAISNPFGNTFTLIGDAADRGAPDEEQPMQRPADPPAEQLRIHITPRSVQPGQAVTVTVTGLNPGEDVLVNAIADNGDVVYQTSASADRNGQVEVEVTSGDVAGRMVTVYVTRIPLSDVFFVEVTAATQAPTPIQPPATPGGAQVPAPATLMVMPEAGPRGTEHTISATGLEADEMVEVRVLAPTGDVVLTLTLLADAAGEASTVIQSEESDPLGVYRLETELANGQVLSAEVTITDEGGAVPAPASDGLSVSVTPDAGPRGTRHTIQVTGLEPGAPVELAVIAPESVGTEADYVYITDTTAGPDGVASFRLVSEAGDPAGVYPIEIRNVDGEVLIASTLTITDEGGAVPAPVGAISMSITPDAGPRGTAHEILATGLTGMAEVTMRVLGPQGEPLYETTLLVDDAGAAGTTLYSEASDPAGLYLIEIHDADGALLASATLAITDDTSGRPADGAPVIAASASPAIVTPGQAVNVSASGFAAREAVTVSVVGPEGAVVYSSERFADEAGSVTLRLLSEADDLPGAYSVRITGESGEARVDFTLNAQEVTAPAVLISPASAPAGSRHLVTIAGFTAGEKVTLDFAFEGERVYAADLIPDDDGTASVAIRSDRDDIPGTYTITVYAADDESQAMLASGAFEVTAPE